MSDDVSDLAASHIDVGGRRLAGRAVIVAVALALATAFAYWVSPTPYKYLPSPRKEILAVRVDRFTGKADYLVLTGWRHAYHASTTARPLGRSRPPEPLGVFPAAP